MYFFLQSLQLFSEVLRHFLRLHRGQLLYSVLLYLRFRHLFNANVQLVLYRIYLVLKAVRKLGERTSNPSRVPLKLFLFILDPMLFWVADANPFPTEPPITEVL